MDPIYAGWLSILPPVIAIILALFTKEVISSLLAGILSGAIIYSVLANLNPVVGTVDVLFTAMVDNIDLYIIIFCCLLGALVQVVSMAGGSVAYGKWASKKLKTRRSAMLGTSILGGLIFIDDYFNCLTVGTVMQPLTDKYKVSRAKLAYIIDSTAAPICIIAPISSWAAAVGSNLRSTGAFTSDFAAFCATIPYNLYALLSIAMVGVLCFTNLDIGPMAQQEKLAIEENNLGAINQQVVNSEDTIVKSNGSVIDMVIPIGALIVFSIAGMLYNGGFWNVNSVGYASLGGAFGNCSAAQALAWGGLGAIMITLALFVLRKRMAFSEFMSGVTNGIKAMVPACLVLISAWTISGVCRDYLQTAVFVKDAMVASPIPNALLPALIFIVAAFLSFSTGTAWGTFGILIPIIVPVASSLDGNLLVVALSATLAGSVFGDHCSPISDTTILASTGAGCDHLVHVSTQLPYALTVAGCTLVGYLVAGFTQGNLLVTLGSSIICFIASIFVLKNKSNKKCNS